MTGEAEEIFDAFNRLMDHAKVATGAARFDLGDEAEALAVKVRVFFSNAPVGSVHPLVLSLGERAARMANDMRARA